MCLNCEAALVPAGRVDVGGVDRCTAAYRLDDRARSIVAALKYRRQRRLVRWLAGRLVYQIPRGADLITWVPANPARRRQRGFDQGQELARALAKAAGVPAQQLLIRSRSDARQTGRSRAERLAGPALSVNTNAPAFVVLVDDVVTTGSSLRRAAQLLQAAGTERIVAVVAVTTPLERDGCLHPSEIASSIREWT